MKHYDFVTVTNLIGYGAAVLWMIVFVWGIVRLVKEENGKRREECPLSDDVFRDFPKQKK